MELKETVELMLSEKHTDRLRAEYRQTKIRAEKLHRIIIKLRAETLEFTPKCDVYTLESQEQAMRDYLKSLEIRAEIEGIDL